MEQYDAYKDQIEKKIEMLRSLPESVKKIILGVSVTASAVFFLVGWLASANFVSPVAQQEESNDSRAGNEFNGGISDAFRSAVDNATRESPDYQSLQSEILKSFNGQRSGPQEIPSDDLGTSQNTPLQNTPAQQ